MTEERHSEAKGAESKKNLGSYYHHKSTKLVLGYSPLDLLLHEKNK